MPPRPQNKRPAVSRGEGSSSAHAPKKTRFVDPADDPTNFAEQVDASLEDAGRGRKKVKTEGYDSDSSDEGEGVVRSRNKAKEAEEDEDDDMFAVDDKGKDKAEPDGKKKKDEFLRLGDIEGQEFGDDKDGGDDDSELSDEPEDEDDAERRKKAGMGFELSGFNMREEMEEGKFTEDGMYVRSFDAHAMHDRWLEDADERAIKQARRRKRARERQEKERMKAEEEEMERLGGKDSIEQQLVGMLKKGETVLEALQRLGALAKKKQKSAKGKNKADVSDGAMDVDKAKEMTSEIDHITHLASTLMSLGDTDVYSRTYEELVRDVRASGKVDKDWVPPSADHKYEYKWDVPDASAQAGQVFGPYGEDEIQAWYKASYFGPHGEKVKVRTVGGDWGHWEDVIG